MSERNELQRDAINVLKETSRTFFIPISQLDPGVQEAVAAAYLCMRAIDEIEDHPELQPALKSELLNSISEILEGPFSRESFESIVAPHRAFLPEVTLRLADWIEYCPETAADTVLQATSIMAKGMADWAMKGWEVKDEQDLDDYTYYVAGLVGVMLSDIWKWHDGTETDKQLAIAYGRGLQSVNILRNHVEDRERGVSFFPEGWELEDMFSYAKRNLAMADRYIEDIQPGSILNFCKIPLALAHGTLSALEKGKEKMSRAEVTEMVSQVIEK
ncbi:squalene/phytoene synthase family protein [Pseudobacillus badius]|uniref:squalene/phytoene synthase family protein n=1 Tax=Bacillus badius TaxID=1455 RepID=UPI0007B0ACD1|nr:phytoene/squalene synthase family protein [Bacillus badius]KZN98605.1 phytoene synthase [Bacillus badius]OCS83545.1 phytoene synthase [Bacillus badius]OVE53170.1 phytoene/squalene synthase family protein [Bacillus badius]TDW05226.1 farnesyl-diphosphate farnesyltransferase [Bacillus badius]